MNNNTKNFLKYTLQILMFIVLGFLLFQISLPKEVDEDLKRLDEISVQLANISKEAKEIDSKIYELEIQRSDLNQLSWALNDEASSIFMKLIWKELEEEAEQNTWWNPWDLNEEWTHQEMPELTWDTSHERFKEMANAYGLDPSLIWKVEDHYQIKEWVILCITIAETSWGNRWYGKLNIWSVGSNDRWDRPTYALMESWLEAIWKTLNNQYLWKKKTLWCLSNAGSCKELGDNGKRYATSTNSWEANMVACLSDIYEPINPETFNIRR